MPTKLDRFGTMNRFVNEQLAPLTDKYETSAPGLVWCVLWSMASAKDGSVLFASMKRLQRCTGLSKNAVRRALRALKDERLVEVRASGRIPVYSIPHILTER